MNALDAAVADYVALRNGLGHQLADAARLLPRFAAWLEQTGQSTITVSAALAWAQQPASPGTVIWSHRMTAVRGFARYMAGIDPATEVPPAGLLPARWHWSPPYIYTREEVTTLLAAAGSMRSPLRAATYRTLFGLLAATGMRVGEAVRLDMADVDWDAGVLLIRQSKFGKSRNIPVLPDTLAVLRTHLERRGEYKPRPGTTSLLVSLTGRRLIYESVHEVFAGLRADIGLGAGSTRAPRIHDLRHTFAVRTLLDWYRDGADVATRLPWLSTYLGHHDPRSTYWYLSAAPELLAHAAARLEPAIRLAVPR
jgi:integrase